MKDNNDEYDLLIIKYNNQIKKLQNDIIAIKYRLKYKEKIFNIIKKSN